MMKSVLEYKKATINITEEKSIKNINFSIAENEFIYLIGKTGSGKSSILRTMYADKNLIEGNLKIFDFDLKNIKKKEIPFLRRKIGIVFQDFKLLPDRSVFKNLEFVLKATNWKSNIKIQERIIDVLRKVDLENLKDKYPNSLSGGEKQRISIARAILNEPKLILADEPTGNLDPATSESIMNLLLEINESGSAIIMATHDYNLISRNPKRTIRVEDERLFELSKKT
ncbi:MAG: ATP-binding cassette domain-containing protein [Flavobacteriaceae bacterium]|nr:ATP-binding cassette domain-containing protein [Flavobacteriaceae bacterium]